MFFVSLEPLVVNFLFNLRLCFFALIFWLSLALVVSDVDDKTRLFLCSTKLTLLLSEQAPSHLLL